MDNQGFFRVAAAVPQMRVADVDYNREMIVDIIKKADEDDVQLLVFPELALTGSTCADLFLQSELIEAASEALDFLRTISNEYQLAMVVGVPFDFCGKLYNCAAVIQSGELLAMVPKQFLSSEERRCFAQAEKITKNADLVCVGTDKVFDFFGVKVGVEIGSDLFAPVPPSTDLALGGAEVIVNLSSSCEAAGQYKNLRKTVENQSSRLLSAYVLSSSGYGESTTDVVMGGAAMIFESGECLAEGKRFCTDSQLIVADVDVLKLRALRKRSIGFAQQNCNEKVSLVSGLSASLPFDFEQYKQLKRTINPLPFIPSDSEKDERCCEIFNVQILGLAKRFVASHSRKLIIGISGGLDSTLALLVAVRTMDKLALERKNVIAVTMPGFGTTDRTYNNAIQLVNILGAELREVSIRKACEQHFEDIGLAANDRGAAYENAQARERTQILMDMANMEGALVVGTGDLSELALGWATYNGDQMSMYGVNAGVPKTLVRYLVQWVANDGVDAQAAPTLLDILDTPISPELLPADEAGNIAQKTEDLVGPYELHDFFLYHLVRYGFRPQRIFFMAQQAFAGKFDGTTIKKWLIVFLRRFFAQQFKRSAMPDGPKIGSVGLSPRSEWRMPSDAQSTIWLAEAQKIEI